MNKKQNFVADRKVMDKLEKMFCDKFFDEVVGMTDPQVNYIQRQKDGMARTKNDMIFATENRNLWEGMLEEDSVHKHAPIFKTYVALFGLPSFLA